MILDDDLSHPFLHSYAMTKSYEDSEFTKPLKMKSFCHLIKSFWYNKDY